jgi:4-aminobutyrate aminotransferase/(S)-3-amino-2-methylpropionate transaminase
MAAFELVKSRTGAEPDPEAAKSFSARALENGLIILSCGVYGNAIRIMVPLTVSEAVLDEGLAIIEKTLVEIARARSPVPESVAVF